VPLPDERYWPIADIGLYIAHVCFWDRVQRGAEGLVSFAATARDPNAKATDWFKLGDVRAEMPKAAATFDAEYLCDYAYHAQMEPLNGVASVSPTGDSAEVWCGTQSQTMALEATAQALGIDRSKVKLHDTLIGGGFGRCGPRDMDFLRCCCQRPSASR
jgi:isoquinoline 1-oxidoreductase beta subunit